MGYYLHQRSRLKPVSRQQISQRFKIIAAIGFSFIAGVIILTAFEFGQSTSLFAENSNFAFTVVKKISLPVSPVLNSRDAADLSYSNLSKTKSGMELIWQTISENENEYYTIERSVSGGEFKTIGCIDGAGTTRLTNTYDFTDTELNSDRNIFYRIRQTSSNGISSVIAIEKPVHEKPLYVTDAGTQPFKNSFLLSYFSEEKGSVSFEIFDLTGACLFKSYETAEQGINSCRFLDKENLSAGQYILRIASDNGVCFQRIAKI